MSKDKKHADFQSKYRQSSNFNDTKKDSDYNLNEKGNLELADNEDLKESDKKKIADAMNSFRERIEQTPGGEQTDNEKDA